MSAGTVIIGAGHGGVQVAASLREEGYDAPVTLLSAESAWPYQRPPLSKAFLKGDMDEGGLPLRGATFFADQRIDLKLGVRAARIDRAAALVVTTSSESIPYDRLVLATGAVNRRPPIEGLDQPGVCFLRTIEDAKAIKAGLAAARRVVVVGAGFIGLEIAATACALGRATTIVEIASRPMGRALSAGTSDFFRRAHEGFGATFRFGVGVSAVEGDGQHVRSVRLSDGARLEADLVVVGAGAAADDALARAAGLACDDGVLVDARLRTSDPSIFAIGDCVRFPGPQGGKPIRLESVQNAVDQARDVAKTIADRGGPYGAVPWFWSDQGDLKLQIAGVSPDADQWVVRGDEAARAFSAFGFALGRLAVVESVNRGADHMAARRILGAGLAMTPEQAADPAFDLRKLALSAPR